MPICIAIFSRILPNSAERIPRKTAAEMAEMAEMAKYPKPPRRRRLRRRFDLFRRGGCKLQCFALFCKGEADSDRRKIENQLALFRAVRPAFEEITGGKAVLTVEGGAASRGDLSALKNLFDSGVKIFSPVWNTKNSLSAPNGAAGGLTAKGKAAMAYALERGAIPDISHASDGAARDIFALADERKAAVCATHSLVRALCPHKRNLTDTQIKKIADSGGVVGVCFVREFAGNCDLMQHVRYLTEKGGENCVAIGGDFYGTENPYPESPAAMPDFFPLAGTPVHAPSDRKIRLFQRRPPAILNLSQALSVR